MSPCRRPQASPPRAFGIALVLGALAWAPGCARGDCDDGACAELDAPASSSEGSPGTVGGDTSSAASSSGASSSDGDSSDDTCTEQLAGGISLRDVSFFQVIGVDVLRDGSTPESAYDVPLVEGRAAILRARVDLTPSFVTRTVALRLELRTPQGVETFVDARTIDGVASGDDPTGDFLLELPADALQLGASYSVALVECGETDVDAPTTGARHPAEGTDELNVARTGPIAIHLVPFEVGGFVPDTSPAVLDGLRAAVHAVYPTTEVVLTVGDVVPDLNDGVVDMGQLLIDLGVIQEQVDQAPPDVYYYGMVTGAATREEFCADCPTGTSESGNGNRAAFAIGAAFGDQRSEDTLIHELGHMHGLLHAPCGDPANPDPGFPYADAAITVEGYDDRTGEFVPADHRDMMAYCYPRWISDYNYVELVAWVQQAQTWSTARSADPMRRRASTPSHPSTHARCDDRAADASTAQRRPPA